MKEKKTPRECKKTAALRPTRRLLPLRKRRGFAPVAMGLTAEEAVLEAKRCLSLGTCETCDVCSLLCPDLCITKDESTGKVKIDLDYCKGCGICAAVSPKSAIKMVREE